MTRVNLLLLAVAIACALGVITAQHKSRKLFIDLEAGQAEAKRLDEEFTQLQLEQGTWSTNKRVEAVASRSLGMQLPQPGATRVITLDAAPEAAKR
ncbi:MAG: cell division protein FtsL [Burkholderiales bacterium]|nr:cell division protein FtsL [Burkholderiales bacterium]